MKTIELTQNKKAIVNNEDYEFLYKLKWHFNNGYAKAWNKGKPIYMHRFLLNVPKDKFTDHINGNGLDNRRSNLRICTNRQNQQNSRKQVNNTSGRKGVTWHKSSEKWQAQIMVDSKSIYLGLFNNLNDAKVVYNVMALKYFGEFAWL